MNAMIGIGNRGGRAYFAKSPATNQSPAKALESMSAAARITPDPEAMAECLAIVIARASVTMIALVMAWIILLGGLAACSQNEKVAGGTSETTNGELTAVFMDASGQAAAGARLRVVDDSDWVGRVGRGENVVLDSFVTGTDGEALIRYPRGLRCNLQVDGPGGGLMVSRLDSLGAEVGTAPRRVFRLAPYGIVSGKVQTDGSVLRSLRLAGTAYRSEVGGDGGYGFAAVSGGVYALVAESAPEAASGQAAPTRRTWLGGSLSVTPGELYERDFDFRDTGLLVDDFEAGFGRSVLGRALGEGFWYALRDTVEQGNSNVTLETLSDSQAYAGTSVHAVYALGSLLSHPWAIMGCQIGRALQGSSYDFSDLRAISFWAKGRGTVNVKLMSLAITRKYTDSAQFFYPLQLAPAWTYVRIPVDSLRLPEFAAGSLKALTWPQVAGEVQALDFTAEAPGSTHGDTVDFFLDDVRLEGLSLKALSSKGLSLDRLAPP